MMLLRARIHTGMLACLALVACKGDGGAATDGAGSTGTTTDEPPTGGPAFDGVRQAALATYLPLGGGVVDASRDLQADGSKWTIEAGGQSYPAVYDGAAWMEYAGVPEGVYLLRRDAVPDAALPGIKGVVSYRETAERELYVGLIYTGRIDKVYAEDEATALSISATGMTPLTYDDSFELYSYNADALDFPVPTFDPEDGSPEEGATTLSGWTVPWDALSAFSQRPLVDFGKGDDLWLTHLTGSQRIAEPMGAEADDPWSYAIVQTLVEAAPLAGATMVDGATAAVSGTFAKAPPQPHTLDVRASAFFDELQRNVATPVSSSCSLSIYLEPGVAIPIYGLTPTLASASVDGLDLALDPLCPPDACDPVACAGGCPGKHVTPGDLMLAIAHGNLFTGGTETLTLECIARTVVTHPTELDTDTLSATLAITGRLADLAAAAIEPKLGLVSDIAVGGAPLAVTDIKTGVGTTPTISFSPPLFGTPDIYTVTVRTIDNVKDGNDTVISARRRIATFNTTSTSVTLPAGILEQGRYYHVLVRASLGIKLTGGPYQHESPSSSATSGLFSP